MIWKWSENDPKMIRNDPKMSEQKSFTHESITFILVQNERTDKLKEDGETFYRWNFNVDWAGGGGSY